MSQSPAPYPANTAEKEATVRRIGLPVGIAAAITGIASLAMLITRFTTAYQPPALVAVNLSFCAMMMGFGILFYIRRTPRMKISLVGSLIAIVTGMAGPVIFAKLSIDFRTAEQSQELANVSAIANAAKQYAQTHNGLYAPDLATLVEEKLISLPLLHSPYERMAVPDSALPASHDLLEKYLDEHTDYQYFGQGLKLVAGSTARSEEDPFNKILIASRRDPIERRDLSIAFTDGSAQMITAEEAEGILKTSNEARKALGFPEVRPPASVERAEAQEKADHEAGR